MKITPNTPHIADVIPSKFQVCGSVAIRRLPERVTAPRKISVSRKGDGSEVSELQVDASGKFCSLLAPGSYLLKPVVTAHEMRAGLQLTPVEVEVKVVDAPVNDVRFEQVLLSIAGKVSCLENCRALQLSLSHESRVDEKQVNPVVVKGKQGSFQFKDILPGKYQVGILNEDWCWKEKSVTVELKDKDVDDVTFEHNGFALSCSVSHGVRLDFMHDTNKQLAGSFDVAKGMNKFCLEKAGAYSLHPHGCHVFEREVYRFDTALPTVVTMNAAKHKVEGRVTSPVNVTDVTVTVATKGGKPEVLGPLKNSAALSDGSGFEFSFDFVAKTGAEIELTPASATILFQPPRKTIKVDGGACPGVMATFQGKQGVFIEGRIEPRLAGVAVTILGSESDSRIDVQSGNDGTYKVGPLPPEQEYTVTAAKEGYVLTAVSGKLGHFTALKLGEISVVVENEAGKPLKGVLLSLSGVDYRNNVLTPDDGTMLVGSLSPGQYFVKPIMKEYTFEPVSQTITVKEGSSVSLAVKAKRVAFSCLGVVTSLNREPESGVMVEAVGVGESCRDLQEEGKTEPDGSFHIRGLQPKCDYIVRLKMSSAESQVNTHIQRSEPSKIQVRAEKGDISDVRIIAFRRINRMDVNGNVMCKPEYLPFLRVAMYKDSSPDSAIHTIHLSQSHFFFFPSIPLDGHTYHLKLHSSQSRTAFDYSLPQLTFVANKTFRHFTFNYEPTQKSVEQELNQSSFLLIPVAIAIVLLVHHRHSVLPALAQGAQSVVASIQQSAQKSAAKTSDATQHAEPAAEYISNKKKKPKRT